jgi:N-acetylglucosamine-6-phosphate deacetylase
MLGPNNIIIISDSLSCKGMNNGKYKLGDLDIYKHTNIATLLNSQVMAGAVMSYAKQVALLHQITKCDLTSIVKMTSYNATRVLKIKKQIGLIAKNYYANFVIVDKNLNVKQTIIRGKVVYRK